MNGKKAKACRLVLKRRGVDPQQRLYTSRHTMKNIGSYDKPKIVRRTQILLHPECGRALYKQAKRYAGA